MIQIDWMYVGAICMIQVQWVIHFPLAPAGSYFDIFDEFQAQWRCTRPRHAKHELVGSVLYIYIYIYIHMENKIK